ncbi:MAG: TonB-dependent receptor, partial [Acidobacteria bacterium]|nr:TonB-dependent receptor [Acidobacteriota bacterium]
SMQGGVNISVAGGLSFGVAYLLDGAMHNNPQDNANLPMPFPDALQEFSVATSGLSAQNGMHSGASVNAVTKSGTNNLHGNAFEFLRDKRFNATEFFAAVGPNGKKLDDGLRRNQYGATLGGPVVQNRLFFFGAYQGTATRQRPSSNISRVPTAAMMAGDFTAFTSPACNGGRQLALRAPFVNNQINPALFSPAAVNLAKRLPTTTDACGETQYSASNDSDEWQIVGRSDYQMKANQSLFGRYMATSFVSPAPYATTQNVLATRIAGLDNLAQSAVAGHTLVLGSNVVNSLRVTYNRTSIHRGNPPFFDPHDLGSNVYSYSPDEMVLAVVGGFTVGAGTATRGIFATNASQVSDDLTVVRGDHQIGIGGSLAYWTFDYLTNARSGGDWNFGGSLLGSGMAEFLMGRVTRMEHSGPGTLPMDQWSLGMYVQDAWRVTPRTTVNAGLRWEPYFGQNVLNGAISNFSMENYERNVTSTVFLNAPAGLIYPGDPGFPEGLSGQNKQWTNFSPRVGLAWDVNGDGRTAVRSSYGLAYDFQTAEYHGINATAPPFGNRTLIEDPTGLFDDPYRQFGGDPHPIITNANTEFIPYGSFGAIDPGINSPRVQSWNVTFEQQFGADWGASISYLGSHSDRLWNEVALNPGVFLGAGPCTLQGVSYGVCTTNANLNQRRELSLAGENPTAALRIGSLDLHTDVGVQDYRGLKLSVRRRTVSGVSVNGNYTWSRCFGDFTTGGFPQISSGYTNPQDPSFDRGYCDQDRRHLGVVTVGYQTPTFSSAALKTLASDWRVSGILSARSGVPLNVIAGGDRAFSGITAQRPQRVLDDSYAADRTIAQYLNPAAFAQPALGTLGDFPRNGVRGPGYWDVNVALSRIVGLGSSRNLELRLEIFNLLNNFNWGNPIVNLTSGTFGRIQTQAGAPRIMQFGVKFGF